VYLDHWELGTRPFSNTPDPRFIYCSRSHEEALTRLFYTVSQEKGAMVLTGDVGCGKTLLARCFINELDPERFELAVVARADLAPGELLGEILGQFSLPAGDPEARDAHLDRIHRLAEYVERLRDAGRRAVVIIDECQLASTEGQLEEMRLLLNMQRNDGYNLTLMLMGQPEFRRSLRRYEQLRQRMALRYHLGPLGADETPRYMRHRLRLAGARRVVFTPGAAAAVHAASGGVPREINNLCDLAMMVAYGKRAAVVDETVVSETAKDMAA